MNGQSRYTGNIGHKKQNYDKQKHKAKKMSSTDTNKAKPCVNQCACEG